MAPTIRRALLIAKRSAYDLYIREHGDERVRALLAKRDPTVSRLVRADRHHQRAVDETRRALVSLGIPFEERARERLREIRGFDLVVTVGGDGTLLSVSHAVGDTPMLGVNSAPLDSVGFLCGARAGAVRGHLSAIVDGRVPRLRLARMRVLVDDVARHERVLNDALFTHPHPAHTSRYILSSRGVTEEQRSSGVWIATATGSTAAIRSAGGAVMPLGARGIQYVVREPYLAPGERARRLRGVLPRGQALELANKMREARVYLDGPRLELSLKIGQRVRFEGSGEPLWLYGVSDASVAARR